MNQYYSYPGVFTMDLKKRVMVGNQKKFESENVNGF